MEDHRSHYRSLFWPIFLIGLGIIWLLVNMGILPQVNVNALIRFWPLILILLGLDLLVGRRSTLVSALIGLATVALMGALLWWAPQLNLNTNSQVQETHLSEPLDQAASAQVTLDSSSEPLTIYALQDSPDLIDVQARSTGRLDLQASGEQDKRVSLSQTSNGIDWWEWAGQELYWKVGLSDAVPLDLILNSGSGSVDADLSGLDLSAFRLDVGSGSAEVNLPDSRDGYSASFEGGSGSARLTLPDATDLTLRLDTGSGSVSVELPSGAAVRVEVRDSGSGSVTLASDLDNVEQGEGDQGVWQTAGYDQAENQINIIVDRIGSGSIRIH